MELGNLNWDRNPDDGKQQIRMNDYNAGLTKQLLDSTGPGFCLAKWKQVTVHLGTGMTHSCHHPTTHKIPLEELKNNVSALHNTEFKKQQRKTMLSGGRPAECDYCWRVEDNGNFSDRHYKSMEYWALPEHDNIAKLTGDENVYPSYLEVSFSNVCNFKCTYCGPESSSQWVDDLKTHGPIKVFAETPHETWIQGWQKNLESLNYKNNEFNPYVDAFWRWWPEAYPHLKVFRITGGEPLLSKETFRVIDWISENPNPDLEFHINTNLGVPEKLWQQFLTKITAIKDSDNVNNITIYTSVDGWGKRAEYARPGLDFELFKTRYEQLVSLGNIRCVIMSTYNIFSVTSFKQLLEWQLALRKKYNANPSVYKLEDLGWRTRPDVDNNELRYKNSKHSSVVAIDVPYLRHPKVLDAHISSHDLVYNYMLPSLDFMSDNQSEPNWRYHMGFEGYEIDKLRRIVMHRMYFNQPVKNPTDIERDDINQLRGQFYDYVNILDQRNGTNFSETFPEMAEFYQMCKEAKEKWLSLQK